ncbi:MAG: hypothetical protein Q8K20_17505 [Gemmobacter sp.]|nr:hypothetical protein [Gemmobacter sp.]
MIPAARRHPWLAAGMMVALLLATLFLARTVVLVAGWGPDPARPVEGWMTPRYLVRVYDLPPDQVSDLLGIAPGSAPRVPLEDIARQRGVPLADLIAAIEALRPPP